MPNAFTTLVLLSLEQAADAIDPILASVPLGSTVPSKEDGTRMHRRRDLSASRLTSTDQKRRALFGGPIRALTLWTAETPTEASPAFGVKHTGDELLSSDRSSCGGVCSSLSARLRSRRRCSPAGQFDANTLHNNMIASSGQHAECGWSDAAPHEPV